MLHRIGNIKGPRILTALGVFAVALSGCAVGPDYRRPDVEVPPGWRLGTTEGAEISNVAWWDQFQDPVLAELVRTALENNKDLQIATANVDQAFAQYGITRSALFPQADASASGARPRASETTGPVRVPSALATFNDYNVNLSASYELDVWGRL